MKKNCFTVYFGNAMCSYTGFETSTYYQQAIAPNQLINHEKGNNWAPQEKIGEIIKKDFPFEKLQAMIDK